MKTLKFDEEEFKRICYEDHDDFETIETIEGASHRWNREMTIIVKHIPNGLFYMGHYFSGLTEMQEDEFFDCELVRCKQVEIKTLEWMEENDEDNTD